MSSNWLRAARRRPLVRRLTGYSAGSLVAAGTGELAFVTVFGWGHAGTTWATAAGFVAAAVPNYLLNRRWAWPDRRGRSRRTEVILYLAVIAVSFAGSAVATHWADIGATRVSSGRGRQTLLVAAAYLGVSGVFFLLKFGLYETVVFKPAGTAGCAGAGEPRAAPTTR